MFDKFAGLKIFVPKIFSFFTFSLFFSLSLFFILMTTTFVNLFYLKNVSKISPELNISSLSPLGNRFGKVVAASCSYYTAGAQFGGAVSGSGSGHADEYQNCSEINCSGTIISSPGTSQCGGACQPTDPNVCNNFALIGITPTISYPGFQLTVNNIYMYTNISGQPTPEYSLGTPTGGVPAGYRRVCEINRISSDGTNTGTWTEDYDTNKTIWTNQPPKTYPYSENIQIRCGYQDINSGVFAVQTAWYRADAAIIHPNYGLPCENINGCGQSATSTYDVFGVCPAVAPAVASCNATNACGQTFNGSICNNVCNAGGGPDNLHNSCINDFYLTSDRISPNGSVEFSWDTSNASSTATCSFVDLTTAVPRPISGLQDLSPTTDKVRITNIQVSTRFCLVCKFYDIFNPTVYLGEAAKHQWVRVQRIGEN